MTLKKVLQIVSLGLLFYLLADSFMSFDFAASKNEALSSMKKVEVETIQNIDTVKQKTKHYLDTIRRLHKKYSNEAVNKFWILFGLIIIQVILFQNKMSKTSIDKNGR